MRHGLVLLVAIVIASVSLALLFRPHAPKQATIAIGEADIGGPFSLTDQKGHAYSDKNLRGHLSLVYFGFTRCTDICPVALTNITQGINELGAEGDKIIPVFITVDPAHDTPKQLAIYAKNFHPHLVALTGTKDQLKEAQHAYKAYAEDPDAMGDMHHGGKHDGIMHMGHGDTENADEAADHTATPTTSKDGKINHSGYIYLMDEKGKYVTHFPHNATPETIADALRTQLRKQAE